MTSQPSLTGLGRRPRFRVEPTDAAVTYENSSQLVALFEETSYQLTVELSEMADVELRCSDAKFLARVENRTNYPVWQGPFKFQGFVGDFVFQVVVNTKVLLSVRVEVFPTKLSYREDYQALLQEIASCERTLPFKLAAPTTVAHKPREDFEGRQAESEWLAVLRWQAKPLLVSLRSIAANPHQELRREALVRPTALVRRASGRAGAWLARHPQFARANRPPERLIDERRLCDLDTTENRYTIGRVRSWSKRLNRLMHLEEKLEGEFRDLNRSLKEFCRSSKLADLNSGPKPRSHVLQHRRDYRSLTQIDRMLRRATERADEGEVPLTLKSLPVLYEYWVLLTVHTILVKELGFHGESRGPKIKAGKGGAELCSEGVIHYTRSDGAMARLTFQGIFKSKPKFDDEVDLTNSEDLLGLRSLTASQHPDGVLVLEVNHIEYPVCVILDAKYKLGRQRLGPRIGDVNTMHRYRDALLRHSEKPEPLMYGVAKAWFVYPGDPGKVPIDPEECDPKAKRPAERLWRTAMQTGVGAIPALPGKAQLLSRALASVAASSKGTLERAHPRTRHSNRWKVDDRAQCLVAIVANETRLKIHLADMLYHMPVDRLDGDVSNIEYLMLGVRHWEDGLRKVEYASCFSSCRFVATTAREQFPSGYLDAIGSSGFNIQPSAYHLFELREHFDFSRPVPTKCVTSTGGLFVLTTVREALASFDQ